MALSRHYNYPSVTQDEESQSDNDTSSVVSEVFSDDEYDDDSTSGSELDSENSEVDSDQEEDDDAQDPGQLSREYYLAKAKELDISQLRRDRYADNTKDQLQDARWYWKRYCELIGVDPAQQWHLMSDCDETVRFLYAYFGWRCDIRRGKNDRHNPGITVTSSLETFWKNWHLVLKEETLLGLSKETQRKVNDVIEKVALEKGLGNRKRRKNNMYIEDVVKFAGVLLSTTEVTYLCGWERIQLLLYTQLASISAHRPGALTQLRYRDLKLTLIRNPEGGRPILLIYLSPEFTKKWLGEKAPNEFKIPEILFDPSLVLSPHVCLLSMLFHIKGFKRISMDMPALDCAEKLYSLGVLDDLGQQELLLQDDILDGFVFCQVVRETTGYRIDLKKAMTTAMLRDRMRKVGEITGFDQVTKPYNLRYAAAKAFNSSAEVTDALQCVMLQHADMRTFIRHYEVDVDVDAQAIVRGTKSQTPLVRFACSLSASIDPNRPYRLSLEESKSLNELPIVRKRQDIVNKLKRKWKDRQYKSQQIAMAYQAIFGCDNEKRPSKKVRRLQQKLGCAQAQTKEAEQKYNRALRQLRNEKQRQRNRRIRENLERYRNEQPVIDMQSQLAGKMIDTKVMEIMEHQGSMSAQHLAFLDRVMTVPGKTLEAEYQRRIKAIDAGTAFCGTEEGRPTRRPKQPRRWYTPNEEDSGSPAKRSRPLVEEETDNALRRSIQAVRITSSKQRPTVCFLCVGNPNIPLVQRIREYATPGSLTRHFKRRHVSPTWSANRVVCHVCDSTPIQDKNELLAHAEVAHGTVIRECVQTK